MQPTETDSPGTHEVSAHVQSPAAMYRRSFLRLLGDLSAAYWSRDPAAQQLNDVLGDGSRDGHGTGKWWALGSSLRIVVH